GRLSKEQCAPARHEHLSQSSKNAVRDCLAGRAAMNERNWRSIRRLHHERWLGDQEIEAVALHGCYQITDSEHDVREAVESGVELGHPNRSRIDVDAGRPSSTAVR